MVRSLTPLLALALLAACATPATYTRAQRPDGMGYSEQQIENNRFFVTYRAPSGADAQLVQDYALLRAADLTLQQGADWFIIDRRNSDVSAQQSGPSIGVGLGGASFGRHSGGGVGVGFSVPLGKRTETATSATLEIRTGRGPKPEDANAYDARATSANLSARLLTHR